MKKQSQFDGYIKKQDESVSDQSSLTPSDSFASSASTLNPDGIRESFVSTTSQSKNSQVSISQEYVIHTHQDNEEIDIIINKEFAPEFKEGMYIEIIFDKVKNQKAVFLLSGKNFTADQEKQEAISILRSITDQFINEYQIGFQITTIVQQLQKELYEDYQASFVEIWIKDIFMSRKDQYPLQEQLQGQAIYTNKQLNVSGIKITVANIVQQREKQKQILKFGIVSKSTQIIFRSLSTHYNFMIEISQEVFQFKSHGEMYWESIQNFFRSFFQRIDLWKLTHKFDILFYARLYYPKYSEDHLTNLNANAAPKRKNSENDISFTNLKYFKLYEDKFKQQQQEQQKSEIPIHMAQYRQ